jgi:hypothetical protein
MELIEILAIMARWVHMLSAIIAVGGAVFMRFVLMPAAQTELSPETRASLHTRLVARWKYIVRVCIGCLLATGSFNFYLALESGIKSASYHALFGIKLITAFAIFFLALALSGSGPGFASLRKEAKKWSLVLISLAVLAVMVSGILRFIHMAALKG